MRAWLFFLGFLLLIVPEFLRVYYIMPFPGSQEDVATDLRQVNLAYWLHNNIWWIRLAGLALIAGPLVHYLRKGNWWKRIAVVVPAAVCALVFYAYNFRLMADKMFYPPKTKAMRPAVVNDSTANHLAIVVEQNGDARAYPIELIGYHHQVLDTVGGEPVMITYCTVCRTGRAWKPVVDGQTETFRLVGMDHFNAMFEDGRTGSWWRQVTGECIAGELKGQKLEEVPSAQMTLAEFVSKHAKGLVFQPDPGSSAGYAALKGYDDGTIESGLEYRDTASWQPKSWVVGVVHNGQARAYDWNDLSMAYEVVDTLGGDSIVLTMHGPSGEDFRASHYSYHLVPESNTSEISLSSQIDSVLSFVSVEGRKIPAYQEFWHSWRTFHPNTTRYEPKK